MQNVFPFLIKKKKKKEREYSLFCFGSFLVFFSYSYKYILVYLLWEWCFFKTWNISGVLGSAEDRCLNCLKLLFCGDQCSNFKSGSKSCQSLCVQERK